jgi:hypothetical protein
MTAQADYPPAMAPQRQHPSLECHPDGPTARLACSSMESARSSSHPTEATVTSLADYLRETVVELDEAIAEMKSRRSGLMIRLAAIEAGTDPDVLEAVADYESLLSEATRRFT